MAPPNLSPFQQAFADARAGGLETFTFRNKLFTAETKEEQDSRLAEIKARQSISAKQSDLQNTPAGQILGAGAPKSEGLLSSITGKAALLLRGSEEDISQEIPQFGRIRETFKTADVAGKARGLDPIEADVERHKTGSRNASLDEGFLVTLLVSQGHEFNTAQAVSNRVIQGDSFSNVSPTGQDLTPGRFAAESMQDSLNNIFGQAEALLIQLGVGSREQPPNVGSVSIDRPGTRTASVGSFVEDGVNKLAELVNFFQTKLTEARSISDGTTQRQSQSKAAARSGRESRQ